MNIDLLFTETGEAGLIASENPVQKAIGVVLDTETGMLTAEYADMNYTEYNIPVEPEYFATLDGLQQIHLGAIKNGNISQAYQVPLMFSDDPYRGEQMGRVPQLPNPLMAFEIFVKSCIVGQPVHREDLGDESAMGCILGDAVPSSLQFAPHLARRLGMEASPKAQPSLNLGPAAPGLGLGSSGSAPPPRNTDPRRRDDQ